MKYKVIMTKRSIYLFDRLIGYLYYKFKNPDVAQKFRNEVNKIICRLEDNPYQFGKLVFGRMNNKDYRGAMFSNMNYVMVYRITDNTVYIMGIFHMKEKYYDKMD